MWRTCTPAVQGVRSCQGQLVHPSPRRSPQRPGRARHLSSPRSGCVKQLKTVLFPLGGCVALRCEATRPRGISFKAVRDSSPIVNQWNNEERSDATSWDQLSEAVSGLSRMQTSWTEEERSDATSWDQLSGTVRGFFPRGDRNKLFFEYLAAPRLNRNPCVGRFNELKY